MENRRPGGKIEGLALTQSHCLSLCSRYRIPNSNAFLGCWRIGVAMTLALLLGACGFHLRGETKLPAAMQRIYIASADPLSSLKRDLQKAFARAGAKIEEKVEDGVAVLQIPVSTITTDVLSVGVTARVKEYIIRYHVEFELQTAAGATLIPKQIVELSRDFAFDQTQALGIAAEQEMLSQELERDMVRVILRRLEMLGRAH